MLILNTICSSSLGATANAGSASASQIKLVAVDPEISRLTNETLIDRLQDETQQGTGTHTTAWTSGFPPLDIPAKFSGGVLGSRAPAKSMVMVELVRRGVGIIPDLLTHLSDARPTKLTVGSGGAFPFMSAWFSDEYDFRFPEKERQNESANAVGFGSQRSFSSYTLKVGDLCYVALGEIVNRQLLAVRYQPSACLVVNSPVEFPSLARAARADWSKLSEAEHESSLRADLEAQRNFWRAPSAIPRLLFYYPQSGQKLVETMLGRPLFDRDAVYHFVLSDLKETAPERQAMLLGQFRATRGSKYVAALTAILGEMASDEQPHRAETRKDAAELLVRFQPELRDSEPLASKAVDYRAQNDLVTAMEAFSWSGLEDAILNLYRNVVQEETPNTIGGRLARGDLALTCARRLMNHAEAERFAPFFEDMITQLKRDDATELQSQTKLPLGNAGYHFALTQRIERYGEFLDDLKRR